MINWTLARWVFIIFQWKGSKWKVLLLDHSTYLEYFDLKHTYSSLYSFFCITTLRLFLCYSHRDRTRSFKMHTLYHILKEDSTTLSKLMDTWNAFWSSKAIELQPVILFDLQKRFQYFINLNREGLIHTHYYSYILGVFIVERHHLFDHLIRSLLVHASV